MKSLFCILTSLSILTPNFVTPNKFIEIAEVKTLQELNSPYHLHLNQELISSKEGKNNLNPLNGETVTNFESISPSAVTKPKIEKNSKATDISFLVSLLQYEHLSVFIYTKCIGTKLISEPVSKIINTHLKRHQDYRDLLISSIKKLKGKSVKANSSYDMEALYRLWGLNSITTEKDILTLTAKTEEYGVTLYNSSVSYINNKESIKLTTSIMSMLGRHSAMLYTLAGQEFIKYPKDILNFSKPTNKPSEEDLKTINLLFNLENRALFVYEAVIATKLLAANSWKTAAKFRDIHKENISKLQSLGLKLETENNNYDLATIAKRLEVEGISRETDLIILLDKIEEQICKVVMSNVERLSTKHYISTFVHMSVTSSQMNSIWDATLDRYKEVNYL